MTFTLIFPGNPIAKKRPRFTRYGKTYDQQDKEKKEAREFATMKLAEFGVLRPIEGEIYVEVTFYQIF